MASWGYLWMEQIRAARSADAIATYCFASPHLAVFRVSLSPVGRGSITDPAARGKVRTCQCYVERRSQGQPRSSSELDKLPEVGRAAPRALLWVGPMPDASSKKRPRRPGAGGTGLLALAMQQWAEKAATDDPKLSESSAPASKRKKRATKASAGELAAPSGSIDPPAEAAPAPSGRQEGLTPEASAISDSGVRGEVLASPSCVAGVCGEGLAIDPAPSYPPAASAPPLDCQEGSGMGSTPSCVDDGLGEISSGVGSASVGAPAFSANFLGSVGGGEPRAPPTMVAPQRAAPSARKPPPPQMAPPARLGACGAATPPTSASAA